MINIIIESKADSNLKTTIERKQIWKIDRIQWKTWEGFLCEKEQLDPKEAWLRVSAGALTDCYYELSSVSSWMMQEPLQTVKLWIYVCYMFVQLTASSSS